MNIITVIGVFIIGITVKNLIANRLQERAAIEEVMAGRLDRQAVQPSR